MKSHFELPQALTACLADSEIEVLSWSAASQELVLGVVKDALPERGVVRFVGVSRVCMAPRFTIAGMAVVSPEAAVSSGGDEEVVFLIQDALGEEYRVVAESITYTVKA